MKTARPTVTNTSALLTPLEGKSAYQLHGWFPNSTRAFDYARRHKLKNPSVPCLLEPVSNTPAELEARLAPWLAVTAA